MASRSFSSFQDIFSGNRCSSGRTRRRRYASLPTSAVCLLGLLPCVFSAAVLANHPDDSCPDTHVDQGEAFEEAYVFDPGTFEKFTDGAAIPVGTPLRASSIPA
jgi:hypothetical protein